ncbi:hypothetical protein SETIT_4G123600v2 [Setaria italica]|uniref:Uncharacterized protein n=1 Tax=Setaria italica TaxID=4555 RepID=K3Y2I5_SETIT|nr:hypothetical protein SETIT_4G123600v2 [Setaria italica]
MLSSSFRDAADMLGLVDTDKSLDDALVEATSFKMPYALRRMFATITVLCEYTTILELWDKHFESMAETTTLPIIIVHSMNLIAIATATFDIAANIMPGGRTAHSRFKIADNNSICNITKQSGGFEDNAIDVEIVNGQHAGKRVFLPRIPLSPSEDITLPFKFKRKLSFAMIINKAQGQTIPNVGIYLPKPVFLHGQLYIALSRGVSRKTTWILAKPNNDVDYTRMRTKNIVYSNVLEA